MTPGPGRVAVPAALADSHSYYFGAAGRRWISALPGLVAERLERWELRVDGAAGFGVVALVIPVVRVDGTAAALKLQPVDEETFGEPVALRAWAGRGAVRLLEHDPASGSLLLERLDAGRPLATLEDDSAAVERIARLLAELNAVPAPPGLRRLRGIAEAMLGGAPEILASLPDPSERRLLAACAGRVAELLAGAVEERLLHWDLHYDNVLASYRPDPEHRWLAIDPKPLAGDPGFELLPALWNRWAEVVATGDVSRAVLRRFDLMTDVSGLDRQRSAVWTAGRVLQNALWDVGRFGASRIHPTHRAIAETLLEHRA
jgi:streptomycin 6-kinase